MPIDVSDLYKPLRDQCKQYPLLDSWAVIHAYMQYLQFKQRLPAQIEIPAEVDNAKQPYKHFHEWELEMLAREIAINAPMQARRSLSRWNEFSTLVNLLKEFESGISERMGPLLEENILLELYRIAHQQFPWQRHPNSSTLTRYYKIFSTPSMDAIVLASIGISSKELYTLGLAMIGHFMTKFALQCPVKIDELGLRPESFRQFVRHFSTALSTLRSEMSQAQSYNEDYAYTFNPLRQFPLVHAHLNGTHHIIAPIPTYLFERFTEGVYYDTWNTRGFDSAFGAAFQQYVGDVLKTAAPSGRFDIIAEAEYHVGKDRKDSIDWILQDETATLFLECKTKRVRLESKKKLTDTVYLNADLGKMADFIAQAYKAIVDAKDGHYSHWRYLGAPIYPIVVTLEDWYAFTPPIISAIDREVSERLSARGIDPNILNQHPYTITSVEDLEDAIQVMAMRDVETVMSKKTGGEKRIWSLHPVVFGEFKEESKRLNHQLFPSDMDAIHPSLAGRRQHDSDDRGPSQKEGVVTP